MSKHGRLRLTEAWGDDGMQSPSEPPEGISLTDALVLDF